MYFKEELTSERTEISEAMDMKSGAAVTHTGSGNPREAGVSAHIKVVVANLDRGAPGEPWRGAEGEGGAELLTPLPAAINQEQIKEIMQVGFGTGSLAVIVATLDWDGNFMSSVMRLLSWLV